MFEASLVAAEGQLPKILFVEQLSALLGPDGHPNSPAYGHLKLPHLN